MRLKYKITLKIILSIIISLISLRLLFYRITGLPSTQSTVLLSQKDIFGI